MTCNNCDNGSIRVISAPYALVPPGAGAGNSAASSPYVPQAGSPFQGVSTVGGALDTAGDLFKAFNPAAWATAPDKAVMVWDAAAQKFVPSNTPISDSQLNAALKSLYLGAAPGSFLHVANNGEVKALPFLSALKVGTPGTADGQVIKWSQSGNAWSLQSALTSGDFSALVAGLPASTAAPKSLAAIDATGNPVKASIRSMVKAVGAATPTTLSFPAAGSTLDISSVTVPVTGKYVIKVKTAWQLTPVGGAEPQGAGKYVEMQLLVSDPSGGNPALQVYRRSDITEIRAVADSYGYIAAGQMAGPIQATAGQVLKLQLSVSGFAMVRSFLATQSGATLFEIHQIAEDDIF